MEPTDLAEIRVFNKNKSFLYSFLIQVPPRKLEPNCFGLTRFIRDYKREELPESYIVIGSMWDALDEDGKGSDGDILLHCYS